MNEIMFRYTVKTLFIINIYKKVIHVNVNLGFIHFFKIHAYAIFIHYIMAQFSLKEKVFFFFYYHG